MDAAHVQKKLELSADEDFILTAWQYRMMQRDIAASKGRHLQSKRNVRNSCTAAVEAVAQRNEDDWSPAIAEVVNRILAARVSPDLEALEDAGPEVSLAVAKRSRALLLLIDLYGFEPWVEGKWGQRRSR
jgi:hypothetical protein